MSMDNVYPQILPCPKPCSSRGWLIARTWGSQLWRANICACVFSADEEDHLETDFPLPSSLDLSAQETPDSSTSLKTKVLPFTEEKDVTKEGEVPVKKKSRAELCSHGPSSVYCMTDSKSKNTSASSKCKNFLSPWTLVTNRLRPGSRIREWNWKDVQKTTGQRMLIILPWALDLWNIPASLLLARDVWWTLQKAFLCGTSPTGPTHLGAVSPGTRVRTGTIKSGITRLGTTSSGQIQPTLWEKNPCNSECNSNSIFLPVI